MNRSPAFLFFPADWRKDPGVQALDYFDRGVWFEILCIMFESEQRGKLVLNGKPMPEEALARLLGLDKQKITTTITTLLTYGVAKVEPDTGIIYNKRMVEDGRLSQIRRECGSRGGNPSFQKGQRNPYYPNEKDKQTDKQTDKQKITPSSSSSSLYVSKDTLSEQGVPDEEKTPSCPHQEIIKLYRKHLPMCSEIVSWKGTRARNLTARWREDKERQSLDWWDDLFSQVAQSKFLTGRITGKGGRSFFANLDWIVKPENLTKILEGRYHE